MIQPLILALTLVSSVAVAQEATVTYRGTEKVTVSSCGNYDGVSSGDWSIALAPPTDKGIPLKGKAANGGEFSGAGERAGSTLTGKVSGINSHGSYWSSTIEASIDGDRLVGRNTGSVRGTSCKFVSEFDTRRSE
ncbi:MAG TPA: hypothetical protein VNV16_03060 [Methylibium sp.]|nr:hypothetical protein [Methylibium sp.]